jgi:hypothetical protein
VKSDDGVKLLAHTYSVIPNLVKKLPGLPLQSIYSARSPEKGASILKQKQGIVVVVVVDVVEVVDVEVVDVVEVVEVDVVVEVVVVDVVVVAGHSFCIQRSLLDIIDTPLGNGFSTVIAHN